MPEPDEEDLAHRVSVVQAMLDRVIHTTDNLDEKVGRIFTSMSFLTVGATILYTSAVANRLLFEVGGVALVPLFFLGFILSVAVATAYMLLAMGPRFRLNPWSARSGGSAVMGPRPTGYADKIAKLREDEWTDYFRDISVRDLHQGWYNESVREVYELSRKVDRKVGEMKVAQRAFLLAILFLLLMIVFALPGFL